MKIFSFLLFAGVALSACTDTCTDCQNDYCYACKSGYQSNDSQCIKTAGLSALAIVCIAIGGGLIIFGIMTIVVSIIRVNRRSNISRDAGGRIQVGATGQLPASAYRLNTQQAISSFRYDMDKDSCMVCLEPNCDIVTLCNHYYHLNCLKTWIVRQPVCPTCRSSNMTSVITIQCGRCKMATKTLNPFSHDAMQQLTLIRSQRCQRCTSQHAGRI